MSLEFLSPWWMIAVVVIAGLALLAVWSRGLSPMPVSTLQFWLTTAGSSGRKDSRKMDPLWLLVAMATTLAALALMQPAVKTSPARSSIGPLPAMICAGAAIPQAKLGSLFVRSQTRIKTFGPLVLHMAWLGGRQARQISARQLQVGITLSGIPTADRVWNVALTASGETIWRQTLQRQMPREVCVNFIGSPPSPLVRLFGLARGVALDKSGFHPALWILNAANADLDRTALAHGDAVLAIAPTVLPGITLRSPHAVIVATGHTMGLLRLVKTSSSRLLNHLSFNKVGFRAIYKARPNSSWKVLVKATGGGLGSKAWPLIAQRYTKKSGTWELWIAVPLNLRSTQWPRRSSFVIFFANVLQRLRDSSVTGHFATRWVGPQEPSRLRMLSGHGLPQPVVTPLAGWMALAAAGLVMVAMIGFVRRFPPFSEKG